MKINEFNALKVKEAFLKTQKQFIEQKDKEIIILILSIDKNDTPIKSTLEAILVKYGINIAKYHDGDLERVIIQNHFKMRKLFSTDV